MTTSTECLTEADKPESTDLQESPSESPATPPSHGRGCPQETVPYSTSHVMGGDLENCSLGRYKKKSTDRSEIIDWVRSFLWHWQDTGIPEQEAAKEIISFVESSLADSPKEGPCHYIEPRDRLKELCKSWC